MSKLLGVQYQTIFCPNSAMNAVDMDKSVVENIEEYTNTRESFSGKLSFRYGEIVSQEEYDDFMRKPFDAGYIEFVAYNLSSYDYNIFCHNVNELDLLFGDMDNIDDYESWCYDIFREYSAETMKSFYSDPDNLVKISEKDIWLITMGNFNIKTEYRDKEIVKYIVDNLYHIIQQECHINPCFVCGVLTPITKSSKDKEMVSLVEKIFEESGAIIEDKKELGSKVYCKCIYPFE